MGHVRVYAISDAIARFHRLDGKNVIHPMGWDGFGLPAENAAIERRIPADEWTKQNIKQMKKQMEDFGCSFDWQNELMTCDPSYYKWTQKLFLMLFKDGLAYQREAKVNWDPVDNTVLADEQVDANGCSWRSGAKVEKKLLRQWFVKTTKFAKQLYDGLDDPILTDWKDIKALQRHWIGKCDGWNFDLKAGDKSITVWSSSPEDLNNATFIAIKKDHFLNEKKIDDGLLDVLVENPFGANLPVLVTNAVKFPQFNDVYIGVSSNEIDIELATHYGIHCETARMLTEDDRKQVLEKSQELGIGGDCQVSSKLHDWLISRQRYWGAPIPIIHCPSCGAVPVKDEDLPVKLPSMDGQKLYENKEWMKTDCPKCGHKDARRESDTMDTFVDSSWYFLRYCDPKNQNDLADKEITQNLMPVDIYSGGKEHAVLHMYYARFITHYLHQKGYVSHPEPFKRLLVQGMVMGRTYRVKGTGKYLLEHEIEFTDNKREKAIEKSSGQPVIVSWEKMSKSKHNGVNPEDMFNQYGVDTIRLIILGDVAPTSHRNWSEATFPGIINWQRRLWMTVHDFVLQRRCAQHLEKSETFDEQEAKLLDAANYFVSGATFNYKYSHQLSVAISKMQGLTNAIRRATPDVMALGKNYERALAAQIIMLAPMAPHFASELWSRFRNTEGKISKDSQVINWTTDVLSQTWPKVDPHHTVELTVKANNYLVTQLPIKCSELATMTGEQAYCMALNDTNVAEYFKNRKVLDTNWTVYSDYEGILMIKIARTDEKVRNAKKAAKN